MQTGKRSQKVSKATVYQVKQQTNKIAKKERKIEKKVNRMASFASRYGSSLGNIDRNLSSDLDMALHSFFDMNHDYYRTTSQGYVETAKSIVSISQNFVIPAGKWLNLAYAPSAHGLPSGTLPADVVGPNCWLVSTNGADNLASPFVNTSGTFAYTQNPYYTATSMNTPGTSWRCIGAHMVLTPIEAPTAQAGTGTMFYNPEMYIATPSMSNFALTPTVSTIENFKIKLKFSGTQKIIAQPPPNDDEYPLVRNAATLECTGGIEVHIQNPSTTNSIAYTLEIKQAYEWEPTISNRTIVQVGSPCMSDMIWPYFTKFVMLYWDKYIVATYDTYNTFMNGIGYLGNSLAKSKPTGDHEARPLRKIGTIPSGFTFKALGY